MSDTSEEIEAAIALKELVGEGLAEAIANRLVVLALGECDVCGETLTESDLDDELRCSTHGNRRRADGQSYGATTEEPNP